MSWSIWWWEAKSEFRLFFVFFFDSTFFRSVFGAKKIWNLKYWWDDEAVKCCLPSDPKSKDRNYNDFWLKLYVLSENLCTQLRLTAKHMEYESELWTNLRLLLLWLQSTNQNSIFYLNECNQKNRYLLAKYFLLFCIEFLRYHWIWKS